MAHYKPMHSEEAFSRLAHGDKASINPVYSSAAILAIVPSFYKGQAVFARQA